VVAPSGTVTFLFTDIEDSTRLWDVHPDEMRDALEQHDSILRSVVASRGGLVFSRSGDGFAVAFGRASDAISAAADMQRALTAATWPDGAHIRVRVGVHTGEAQERQGDYFGTAVNCAARLMAAGHGGQVLVSGATAAVAALPPDVGLVDLGVHHLRGLSQPVVVRMLTGEGLPTSFPPMRVGNRPMGNLPTTMTALVGRSNEIAAVRSLLNRHRMVTVVGPGGVGKTRVAIEVAARSAGLFGDGAWFVDLVAVTPGQVAAAIASPLSIQLGTSEAEQRLVSALSGQRLLLVLDNCEHVLDDTARLARMLVSSSDGVSVLGTSRQPLGVPGEQLFPLHPLSDDAVTLFVERARLLSPGFDPSPAELATITSLCKRLDGLPLAIELAAARIRSHTLDELVDLLDARFQLLRSGRRHGHDRHDSMMRTLDWSYDLLDPDERAVFERCSVFSGPFTRSAAAAISCCDDASRSGATDIIDSLVSKSMINVREHSGRVRHLELLDTMRGYGAARLAARGEQSATAAAHARWYADHAYRLGAPLFGSGEAERMRALADSVSNCRAAFRHLVETDRSGAERLCGGFACAEWLMVYEPFEWALALWDPEQAPVATDAHLWCCATTAWAAMGARRSDLLNEVMAHLEDTGADPCHPAVLEAEYARWGDRLYRTGEHSDTELDVWSEDLRARARCNGSGYNVAQAAVLTAGRLPRERAIALLDDGIRHAEQDDALTVAALLLIMRSNFVEAIDAERAADDLRRACELAALTDSPFVNNHATDTELNSRLSHLDAGEKLLAADQLLVSWHRAGDMPRVFSTLATIITLLDGRDRDRDIVFLDKALRHNRAQHVARRVRRRQASIAQRAGARLGPAETQTERTKASQASITQVLLRAREAIRIGGARPT
jgi:predicted ATPase/class 3 adenylate cyclase